MSTQLAVAGVSAYVGFLVGGPTGAAIGWSLGSYYAAPDSEKPEIGDLRVQTSQYGTGLPFVAGKQRLAGNIIWAADKTTYDVEQGGGKGGGPSTTQVGYKISMAIAICQGPILGITKVWEQGKLTASDVYSGSPQTVMKLPGKLYLGSNTQNPDPTIEAHEGAGNVPAYRGIAYIVLEDFDLGTSGAIPQFSFEVVKDVAL